jgi:hypothetical protein
MSLSHRLGSGCSWRQEGNEVDHEGQVVKVEAVEHILKYFDGHPQALVSKRALFPLDRLVVLLELEGRADDLVERVRVLEAVHVDICDLRQHMKRNVEGKAVLDSGPRRQHQEIGDLGKQTASELHQGHEGGYVNASELLRVRVEVIEHVAGLNYVPLQLQMQKNGAQEATQEYSDVWSLDLELLNIDDFRFENHGDQSDFDCQNPQTSVEVAVLGLDFYLVAPGDRLVESRESHAVEVTLQVEDHVAVLPVGPELVNVMAFVI